MNEIALKKEAGRGQCQIGADSCGNVITIIIANIYSIIRIVVVIDDLEWVNISRFLPSGCSYSSRMSCVADSHLETIILYQLVSPPPMIGFMLTARAVFRASDQYGMWIQ